MPAEQPASPLITPDLRRRLQQRYEEAQRLAAASKPNFQRIHELLAECLRGDPGSVLYLDALLANLRRWQSRVGKSWISRWFPKSPSGNQSNRATTTEPTVLSTEYSVLRAAPETLLQSANDAVILSSLADAAAACDLEQAELRYRQLATEAAPTDVAIRRRLAQTLTRQGRFADAAQTWREVIQTLPQDAEAQQALSDIGTEHDEFDVAERSLAEAQAKGESLLKILEKREELQLTRSKRRLDIARRRAAHDQHPQDQSLVGRFASEHGRLEIEILHLRCERLPQDWRLRVELARRQKLVGNFSGAVQRLEEAERLRAEEPSALIELGECWQHLRQFPKALDYYRRAIAAAGRSQKANDPEHAEALKLGRYRAGILAAALGMTDEAGFHLTALVAADPSFKDAQQRLDNLRLN